MQTYKEGDRVALNQDYDGIEAGAVGWVAAVADAAAVSEGQLVYVRFDDGRRASAFARRLDPEQVHKFKVGDRVVASQPGCIRARE